MHRHIQRIARWLLAALLLALGPQALAASAGCQAIEALYGQGFTLPTGMEHNDEGWVDADLDAGETIHYVLNSQNSVTPDVSPNVSAGVLIWDPSGDTLWQEWPTSANEFVNHTGSVTVQEGGSYVFYAWGGLADGPYFNVKAWCTPPAPPAITAQPPSPLPLAVGSSGTLGVAASNATGYEWQVDTGGGTFAPLADGAPYAGTATATLQINGATMAMNGYRYRARVTGAVAPEALSDAATLAVSRAAPTATLSVTSASTYGDTVTFTATVAGGASPTGTVEFREGATLLGSGTLAGGAATFQTAALAAGSHTVTAAYTGDGDNAPATSGARSVAVAQAAQAVAFTSTPPAGAVVGGTYAPTASATSGLPAAVAVDPASASVCVLAGGVVTFSAPGTCTLNASQPGDANHTAAPQVQQPVAVGQAAPTVALAASPPAPVYGTTVTFTATVAGGAAPTGAVEFREGATLLGTGTLAGGRAAYQSTALTAGIHAVTAHYAGDAGNAPAASTALNLAVAQAAQTVAFTTTAPGGAVVGGTYTPTATATSGLAAVIAVDAASTGVCAIAGAVVSFNVPGTCTLNASQPGDTNHTAAALVQQQVTVAAAPAVPGAPAGVTATPGDAAARVGWAAPPSPQDITGYTATARVLPGLAPAGSCTAAPGETGCVIGGLANGTLHAFTVHATNAQGDGPESSAAQTTPAKLHPIGTTVPGASGGPATVVIGGGQPGCALAGTPQFSDTAIPGGAPAQAHFPVGAFSFQANGCKTDMLTVSITYPKSLPGNVQLMKFGPKTALASTSEWFPAPDASISQDRKTVTYTVRDNGPGDSNSTEGEIADPFAPMALPVAPGAQAIPTLSEWGLALLSLLAAAFGLRAARRRA